MTNELQENLLEIIQQAGEQEAVELMQRYLVELEDIDAT